MLISKKDIISTSNIPLYKQVSNHFLDLIEAGKLKKGDKLPSVNELCDSLKISRVTIVNAYIHLRKSGAVEAKQGKGFYITGDKGLRLRRVFLLFDAMNSYKEELYRAFLEGLGPNFTVDIFFHYYNLKQFERFIVNNLDDYHYYAILPHFNEDVSKILKKIPQESLVLIDNDVIKLPDCSAIYQNFRKDVHSLLNEGFHLMLKYNKLNLITGSAFQFVPQGIIEGFVQFCEEHHFNYAIFDKLDSGAINRGEAYLVFSDNDLVSLIQFTKKHKWQLGKDIGLVSYDETPLKSLLEGGITVITTDFRNMGLMAAKMITEGIKTKLENPCRLIIRNSL